MKVGDIQKYKENLYAALSRDLSEFEKNFLLIAAGLLAFSITFIEEIVTLETAEFLPLLFLSWFFIVLAIGLMMITFLQSAYACDKIWKHVDDFIISKEKFADDAELEEADAISIKNSSKTIFQTCKSQLKKFRLTAIVSFLFGITVLALFVGLNITRGNSTKKDDNAFVIKIDKKDKSFILDNINLSISDSVITIKKIKP